MSQVSKNSGKSDIPLLCEALRGGVAAPVIKSSEATEAAQTGWSDRRAHVFDELTTPAAPYRNGTFFLVVRPPLLAEEGNIAQSHVPRRSEARPVIRGQ